MLLWARSQISTIRSYLDVSGVVLSGALRAISATVDETRIICPSANTRTPVCVVYSCRCMVVVALIAPCEAINGSVTEEACVCQLLNTGTGARWGNSCHINHSPFKRSYRAGSGGRWGRPGHTPSFLLHPRPNGAAQKQTQHVHG